MKRLRRAGILGVGLVPFDRYEDVPVESIARPAVIAALEDAGIERTDVDAAFVSHLYQGEVLGQRILKGLRFPEITVTNIENACAGGSSAVREGWLSVATGENEVVLVVGAEKMGSGLVSFVSADVETALGNTAPAQYALAARRHMHEFDTSAESFARIAVKSRYHALAQFQCTIPGDRDARMKCWRRASSRIRSRSSSAAATAPAQPPSCLLRRRNAMNDPVPRSGSRPPRSRRSWPTASSGI